jgi:hypothetical protein
MEFIMRQVAVLFLVLGVTSVVLAADKPVKANKQWMGSVADANLAKNAPTVITSTKQLEKLWKDWKIADKAPEVDFTKEIVIVQTTVGSKLNVSFSLDDNGNLKILGLGTSDFGEGFRYVIQSVNREGIKKVDGKELPKE